MQADSHLQGLEADVAAARQRVAIQLQKDPDHEVALAMYRKDLERAEFRLAEFRTTRGTQRRVYRSAR